MLGVHEMKRAAKNTMTFKLIEQFDTEVQIKFRGKLVPKAEQTYVYQGPNGEKVCFHAASKAWTYKLIKEKSNAVGEEYLSRVVNAFCEAGMNGMRAGKSFNEAVAELVC
jgi:hypothetical protein